MDYILNVLLDYAGNDEMEHSLEKKKKTLYNQHFDAHTLFTYLVTALKKTENKAVQNYQPPC